MNFATFAASFFFIFKHSSAPERPWKIFHGDPGKSWIFLSVNLLCV